MNGPLCLSENEKTTLMIPFTFWKWNHIKKYVLEMKAHLKKDHSETHFDNENMLSELVVNM